MKDEMKTTRNLIKTVGVEIDGEIFILRDKKDIAFVMEKISFLEPLEQNEVLNEIFNKFLKIFNEIEEGVTYEYKN